MRHTASTNLANNSLLTELASLPDTKYTTLLWLIIYFMFLNTKLIPNINPKLLYRLKAISIIYCYNFNF
ncbi:hypothetical protein UT300005_01420 [Clostridium sp. CTA-5]